MIALVCPVCRSRLRYEEDAVVCAACARRFERRDGFVDLIVGPRFEDNRSDGALRGEEASSRHTVLYYWLPLFRQFWPEPGKTVRILSVGCGIGTDVDLLRREGFAAIGIDCGSRTRSWKSRTEKENLILANGMKLPFDDESFDGAYCGCVYPHVGVVGDSAQVSGTQWQDRSSLASEMLRVLKPGGRIFASSANRRCPLDLFHGREPGKYVPQLNRPSSEFLLSVADYRRLFESAGAHGTRALPVQQYWGFMTSKKTLVGILLSLPVRLLFWITSKPAGAFLRGSSVDPWIVVTAQKSRCIATF